MTKEKFLSALATIEEGLDGQPVTAAQKNAAAAVADARDCYHRGDFAGAVSAIKDAVVWVSLHQLREACGDDPTKLQGIVAIDDVGGLGESS